MSSTTRSAGGGPSYGSTSGRWGAGTDASTVQGRIGPPDCQRGRGSRAAWGRIAGGSRRKMSATGQRDVKTSEYTPEPRRWRAFWVTLTAGFMSLLDVSIVAVALPSMQEGLGASPAGVQWVVSGYALTFGLALVSAGRLGDAYGRRRLFLGALAGFVVCSAAAGAAQSIVML